MNKRVFLISLYLSALLIFATLQQSCAPDEKEKPLTQAELIERGKYLTDFGGCHDCHSPKVFTPEGPQPDETRLLSGHPADLELPPIDKSQIGPGKWMLMNNHLTAGVGPWGVSFAINLTPDDETGIGRWQEEMFINAMRTGKHLGAGRPILPPMPWFTLATLTDEDIKAVFAYLKSIKPISNKVPDPIPPTEL